MEALKYWLSLVKASYQISLEVVGRGKVITVTYPPSTEYTIVPLEDYDLHNLPLIAGKPSILGIYGMRILFDEYLTSLNLSLVHLDVDKREKIQLLMSDENIRKLIDEIRLEGEPKIVTKVPDELYKRVFYESLLSCEYIPSMEEMFDHIGSECSEEVETMFREIEREYHEQLWQKLLPYIPSYAIEDFSRKMIGMGDLPKNFIERMKLSPLLGLDYVQSQRKSDFGNCAIVKVEKQE